MKNKLLIIFVFCLIGLGTFLVVHKNNDSITLGDTSNVVGDVDGNGKIGISDYVLVRKYILQQASLSNDQIKRADINSDGKVLSSDYIAIRKLLLGNSNNGSLSGSKNNSSSTSSNLVVYDSDYNYIVANYNVCDYGADPSGVKDSTSAFQKALGLAYDCTADQSNGKCPSGGSTVYVPPGKYLIKGVLSVPTNVALIGSLKEGTTDGTVLLIDHGANSTDVNHSAIIVEVFGTIQNIAFFYPNQKINNGKVTPYPPTITFGGLGADGVTLENINFVNSYIAMDFATVENPTTHILNKSIEYIRRVYGTPLNIGFSNDGNYDTLKMENINFSPKYWAKSTITNTNKPTESTITNYLKSKKAVGMQLKRVDWFMLSNINVDGYYAGIEFDKGTRPVSVVDENGNSKSIYVGGEGEIFDSKLTNCVYPIYAKSIKHAVITNTELKASGDSSATALYILDSSYDLSIYNSTLTSTGESAIDYRGDRSISIMYSKIDGRIIKKNDSAQLSLVGDSLNGTGYENCVIGEYTPDTKKVDYKKRVVTKPKSKSIKMITANNNEDISEKVKTAINELKSTGGIVYIPKGNYKINKQITVPSGIEIRGSISWAHHEAYVGTTIIETTYKGGPLFLLKEKSGLNGFAIRQKDNANNSGVFEYPYAIKGEGKDIYIMNIVLGAIYNGIDLTGCNNHYVEHIWGEFFNIGINVDGGSKNGIIRDCHFTTSVLRNTNAATQKTKAEIVKTALTNQKVIQINNSENEVILNIFTFGPGIAYSFNGANNFYAVGIGTDIANTAVKITKNSTGRIINPLLVTKSVGEWEGYKLTDDSSISTYGKNCNYVKTTDDYIGVVEIINSLNWGNNKGVAYSLSGKGNIIINGGIIENSASPVIKTSNSAQAINGIIIGTVGEKRDKNEIKVIAENGAGNIYMSGNLCAPGTVCSQYVVNNSSAAIGIIDPSQSCKSKISTSDSWNGTMQVDTFVTAKAAKAKICGLGEMSGTLEYKSDCDSLKTATISSNCANIEIKACNKNVLRYRVNNSSWKTVNDIGKYLIFGQIYNQLLYANQPVSNNMQNIGAWVNACNSVSECVRTISSEAVNIRTKDTSTEFASYIYKGVLGRGGDPEGIKAWAKAIDNGTPKMQIINGFIDSVEAHEIYNAWGYN